MILTEGPMKADVIHTLTGLSVLAIPGVNSLTQLKSTQRSIWIFRRIATYRMGSIIYCRFWTRWDSVSEVTYGIRDTRDWMIISGLKNKLGKAAEQCLASLTGKQYSVGISYKIVRRNL